MFRAHTFILIIFVSNIIIAQDTILYPPKLNKEIIQNRIDSLNKLTSIELDWNENVYRYIKYYLTQRREQVARMMSLSSYYFPVFEEHLDKYDLPFEIKFLPIIESGLNPHAKSPVGATGIWQFMHATAKEYNLRINSYLDERKDIYKSTEAACQYLEKSYKQFNDWHLALASYNAGRRNIKKAIIRSGGQMNFWAISPFLPGETSKYIPSFIAAVYVMTFAEQHGIRPDKNYILNNEPLDSLKIDRAVKIAHLAHTLGIEEDKIQRLNPSYRIQIIPELEGEKFPIILPEYKVDLFLQKRDQFLNTIDSLVLLESEEYPEYTDIRRTIHIVRSGDVLGRIANKYNCSIKDIMAWNKLNSTKIMLGQRLKIFQLIN